jgi:D-alanine-D-alanine ligase
VVKAVDEGSSLGLEIVGEGGSVGAAVERLLAEYPRVVVERFVAGREVTVGVVQVTSEKLKVKSGEGGGRGFAAAAKRATPVALPVLWIEPAGGVYDYDAKYDRQDTAYRFDHGLGEAAADRLQALAVATFEACGARDLGRVDFIVDGAGRPWMLEINTMPGFTDHSLLPMAAERAGLGMVGLCDGLVRRAGSRGVTSHKSQVTSDK